MLHRLAEQVLYRNTGVHVNGNCPVTTVVADQNSDPMQCKRGPIVADSKIFNTVLT